MFLYSRYGHGGSDALQEPRSVSYMHHEAQVVLPEILRKAGIERPLLLGHSDGASIAILYAGTFPESPAGLILEAPHVFVEDITVSSIAQARVLYNETDLPQRLGRYHANVDSLFWGWNNIWLDSSFRNWNIESFLDSIRCPVLVIQGAQDEYGTTQQIDAIQRRIPSASAVSLKTASMRHIGTAVRPRFLPSASSYGPANTAHKRRLIPYYSRKPSVVLIVGGGTLLSH